MSEKSKFPIRVVGRMNGKATYVDYFDSIDKMAVKLAERADIVNGLYVKDTKIDYIVSFDCGLEKIWEVK